MERKFINGKRYDTTTAKKETMVKAKLKEEDPYYFEEVLYMKVNGEFFLHGKGGSMSRYASRNSDEIFFTGGEDIIPITRDQAQLWAERNNAEIKEEYLFDVLFNEEEEEEYLA